MSSPGWSHGEDEEDGNIIELESLDSGEEEEEWSYNFDDFPSPRGRKK